MNDPEFRARLVTGVADIAPDIWDGLAGTNNPFVGHAFLSALEDSGSVGPGTGWQAAPLLIEDATGDVVGAVPLYAKGHSRGEYVFDQAWADAYERAGGQYYPKFQIAVPFTPATGPRLLLARPDLAPVALAAAEQVCRNSGFSSVHATFIDETQQSLFEQAGWLMRSDIQFHWFNRGYATFEDFLGSLSARKRKTIRKEREAARAGLAFVHLTGGEIAPEHWDAFWRFYQDTGSRKWGQPYLTRAAFDLFGERLGEQVVLMLALDGDEPIAGALNFLGGDALFGRYWGCTREVRFLHFELCYYQAIELAIARGLDRVEAGAQGPHKLARGYEPVETWSAHWIADPGLRRAIADYLERERAGIAVDREWLAQQTPFRKG